MTGAKTWPQRVKEALACEECRRWRRAALLALAALALAWLLGGWAQQ